jgi:hypothetical protein
MMEDAVVPLDAQVDTYFASPLAENVMPQLSVTNGPMDMRLANLYPIPYAWAPSFMDSKTTYEEALKMGRALLAALVSMTERT